MLNYIISKIFNVHIFALVQSHLQGDEELFLLVKTDQSSCSNTL